MTIGELLQRGEYAVLVAILLFPLAVWKAAELLGQLMYPDEREKP